MPRTVSPPYDQDFHAWLTTNVELMRQGRLNEVDADNIAEELEAMSKREKRELVSRMMIVLAHLLKWQFQPARRSRSWRNTLAIQRSELAELLEDSPSLRVELEQYIERAYERARLLAEDETEIEAAVFPRECPYALDEILNVEFLPDVERGAQE